MSTNLEAKQVESGPAYLPPESILFGRSESMGALHRRVAKLAAASVPVLIQGESGTGKEVLAKFIHSRSALRSGPFVKVSCAAIPGTLLESELFGYQKGAFSGAYTSKPGRVELAHRGTLLLDEIAELDSSLQAKLLQVLEDGRFCRIGGQDDEKVEIRVICTTSRDLEREIAEGRFRQDLFYRINVCTIRLPGLRERKQDIPELANYFLRFYTQQLCRPAQPFSHNFLRLLWHYDWPGNIRELENCVTRYVILDAEEVFEGEFFKRATVESSLDKEMGSGSVIPLKRIARRAVQETERLLITKVLQENNWNRRTAARILDISYRALIYKMREAGLPRKNPVPKAPARNAERSLSESESSPGQSQIKSSCSDASFQR